MATAEFTSEQLDDTTESVAGSLKALSEQMASMTKTVQNMAAEVPTYPGKIYAAPEAEKPKIKAEFKKLMKLMCQKLGKLDALDTKAGKSSAEAKQKLAKIQEQVTKMALDPTKIKDEATFNVGAEKIQQAISTLDASMTSAAMYLETLSSCKQMQSQADKGATAEKETSPLETLFEMKQEKEEKELHLPSVLLGFVSGTAFVSFALLFFRINKQSDRSLALMEEGNLE